MLAFMAIHTLDHLLPLPQMSLTSFINVHGGCRDQLEQVLCRLLLKGVATAGILVEGKGSTVLQYDALARQLVVVADRLSVGRAITLVDQRFGLETPVIVAGQNCLRRCVSGELRALPGLWRCAAEWPARPMQATPSMQGAHQLQRCLPVPPLAHALAARSDHRVLTHIIVNMTGEATAASQPAPPHAAGSCNVLRGEACRAVLPPTPPPSPRARTHRPTPPAADRRLSSDLEQLVMRGGGFTTQQASAVAAATESCACIGVPLCTHARICPRLLPLATLCSARCSALARCRCCVGTPTSW